MFQIDAAVAQPLFNLCDSNGESVVSFKNIKNQLFPDDDEFSTKKLRIFDTDDSGKLTIDEFIYTMSWLGDTFTRLIIKVRK